MVKNLCLLLVAMLAFFAPLRLCASMNASRQPGAGSRERGGEFQLPASSFPLLPRAREWAAAGAVTDHFRKNTKEESDSGLVNEGRRYFNPELGTFMNRDPLGFADGPNVYSYVHQNPWTSFDPDGLQDIKGYRYDAECEEAGHVRALGTLAQKRDKHEPGFDYASELEAENDRHANAIDYDVKHIEAIQETAKWCNDHGMDVDENKIDDAKSSALGFDIETLLLGGDVTHDQETMAMANWGRTKETANNVANAAMMLDGAGELRAAATGLEDALKMGLERFEGGGAKNSVTATIDMAKHPEAAQHALDAQAAGHPNLLTIERGGADANRAASTKGLEKVSGKQLDEYPPAMFKEGGSGASVRPISPSDNMGAGASMGNQLRPYPNGTQVQIKVIDSSASGT